MAHRQSTARRLLSCLLCGLLCFSLPLFHVGATDIAPSEKEEIRAIWLRPKETDQAGVDAAVKKIADAGLNTIFLETVFNGYTIFPISDSIITQSPDFNGFDVLAAYLKACKANNIKLHCWVESFFVGMDVVYDGGPVVKAHPEWLLTSKQGKNYEETIYGKMYFLNPAKQECRDFLVSLYTTLCTNYEIDGIQLDYVRYPEKTAEADYGFDADTLKAFAAENNGADPTNAADGSDIANAFTRFRQEQVTKYVAACVAAVKKARPSLIVTFSVSPGFDYGESNYMQSARLWMNRGYGDYIVPMCYDENAVAEQAELAVTAAGGTDKTIVGLSAQSNYTTESLSNQVKEVQKAKCGVAIFEYESFFAGGYDAVLKADAFAAPAVWPEVSQPEKSSAPDTEKAQSTGNNNLLYLLIGAAAVVVLLGVGLFLGLRKRPKKAQETQEDSKKQE